jgi:hypothetical protein
MLRSRRLVLILCLILTAASTLYYLRNDPNLPESLSSSLLYEHHAHEDNPPLLPHSSLTHPIHQLITKADSDFQTVLSRQSRSLPDAVAEYRRRYKIPPPPNFDKWYAFATRKNVVLTDEYDTIYQTLQPFWALRPSVIRERVREAIGFDNALITVMIRDGRVTKTEGGGEMYTWHREALPKMMDGFVRYLPDMDLAFNVHDEPRVVMQHDDLNRHIALAQQEMGKAYAATNLKNGFTKANDMGLGLRIKEYKTTRFNRFAHQPTWSNSRISCAPDSPARLCINDDCRDNTTAYSGLPLNFIANTTAYSDICNSPSLETSFGFFDRPNAFDVTHDLIPIFSQSKVSSFQDILYPSPWYYMGRVRYEPERDMAWSEKTRNLYWRGSTTGGFSRDGGWRRQHRQKFLMAIQAQGRGKILNFDESASSSSAAKLAESSQSGASTPPSTNGAGRWRETEVPMSNYSHLLDVKFTHIGQCDPGDCDAQRAYFGTVEPVNMFDAFQSKYLLDIDGNAFSGRYYAWLLSNSLVYKLALFREWHDEWIRGWVHYVPLGLASGSSSSSSSVATGSSGSEVSSSSEESVKPREADGTASSSDNSDFHPDDASSPRPPSPPKTPISNERGTEVIEALRYFDSDEAGKQEAERLARQGREWAKKVLREGDMEVWFFRLLLEYGRVIDDKRENIGFAV